jgi:protein gp37
MAEYSKIDYLLPQHNGEEPGGTWPPWIGCDKHDPDGTLREGCRHCWAEMWARRNPRFRGHWGRDKPRYFFGEEHWKQPLRWQRKCERLGRRKRVLVSLCDPLEVLWPPGHHPQWRSLQEQKDRFCRLIEETPALDWLVLTKRPQNIWTLLRRWGCTAPEGELKRGRLPNNVWVGVSVWDQASADRMIPPLLEVPAAVRWVSAEPLLGPLDLGKATLSSTFDGGGDFAPDRTFDWLVVGCESRGARPGRPCDPRWARALGEQCKAAGVPMFTKQLELEGWPGRLVKSKELGAFHWPVQLPEARHG